MSHRVSQLKSRTGQWPLITTQTLLGRMARNRWAGSVRTNPRLYAMTSRRQAAMRSMTFTKRRKKRQTHGTGVTTQHDARLIYKKKRMPRRQRKKWIGFVKKVNAVAEKSWGSQTVVHNRGSQYENTSPNNQVLAHVALYGLSSTDSFYNDLQEIAGYNNAATTVAATGLTVDSSSKVFFQSAILDLTIRNASTNNGALSPTARMEVDVYELTVKVPTNDDSTIWTNLVSLLSVNPTDTMMIGGIAPGPTYAEINPYLRGVTPFELSYVLSRFGIRIYRKTKYQLANNDQITYQLRDPGRHVLTQKTMENGSGFNQPGLTKCVLIVGKLAPGLNIGAVGTDGVYQERLYVGCTRKYMYKIENWSEDRTVYRIGV